MLIISTEGQILAILIDYMSQVFKNVAHLKKNYYSSWK